MVRVRVRPEVPPGDMPVVVPGEAAVRCGAGLASARRDRRTEVGKMRGRPRHELWCTHGGGALEANWKLWVEARPKETRCK